MMAGLSNKPVSERWLCLAWDQLGIELVFLQSASYTRYTR